MTPPILPLPQDCLPHEVPMWEELWDRAFARHRVRVRARRRRETVQRVIRWATTFDFDLIETCTQRPGVFIGLVVTIALAAGCMVARCALGGV